MTKSFWDGFYKKAEPYDFPELSEQQKDDERVNQPPPILGRTISKAGPVLSDITSESDQGQFPHFKE
jgi:hypothetical protein